MPSSLEQPQSSTYIARVNFSQRKEFIEQKASDFPELALGKYRGTEKQNIALLDFLRKNPTFREKWEQALMGLEKKKSEGKTTLITKTKDLIRDMKDTIVSKAKALKNFFSAPSEKNPETGTPLCSKTARENLNKVLGFHVAPRGDAEDVHGAYGRKPGMVMDYQNTSSFDPPDYANVADISIKTRSLHGHRVVAYMGSDGWYVLDPYNVFALGDTAPKPIGKYLAHMESKGKHIRGIAYYQKN